MIDKIVLDASVILEWLAEGEKADAARKIHNNILEGKVAAWAPDFLLTEVVNILFWRKKFTPANTGKFIETLVTIGINFDDEPDYLKIQTIIHLVSEYRITAYDAQYLLLAQKIQCKLVSFDTELLKIRKWVTAPVSIGATLLVK